MNFGCWNIQGLRTKDTEVFQEIQKQKMDIVVLTETKKKGHGNERKGEYLHFYSGVDKERRARAGVSILINKNLEKYVKNWNAVNERIITIDMKGLENITYTVIGVYAPTDDATLEVKDEFYENMTEVLDNIGRRNEIILMGDLNGRTGRKVKDKVVGQYGEDVTNDNGTRLIQLCQQYDLKIQNGFFQHKEIHKFTWKQNTRGLQSIIDYVITKQESSVKMLDVRVQRGAVCGSDHFLIKAKLIMKLKVVRDNNNNKKEHQQQNEIKYNLDSLQHDSTVFLYKLRLATKMKQPLGAPEQMYDQLKIWISEAAKEALGERKQIKTEGKSKYWWSDEIAELVEEKKQLYLKWLNTKDDQDKQTYRRYCYLVKKEVTKLKNQFWDRKCTEIDGQLGGSKARAAWNTINNLRKNKKETWTIDPIGLETWKKYYEELLTEDRNEFKEVKYDVVEVRNQMTPVTIDEVKKAIKTMKGNKAAGPGGVPIELYKNAPDVTIQYLTTLFQKCLDGEEIPVEWKIAQISSLYKKGDKKNCANYRGLSVTASTGRLYGRILRDRIEKEIVDQEEQSGFRPGRSCIDNVFCLKQMIEKTLAHNSELHIAFIDLKKAYDSIPINRLWTAMERSRVNDKYINAVKKMYKGGMSCVKSRGRMTDMFYVNKGLRQGCCVSPTLFKIYINAALERWCRKCQHMGVHLGRESIFTLLFADDQVVIAEDEEDLEYMLRKLIEEYEEWGLEVNSEKTQYLAIGREGRDLNKNGKKIRNVDEYKYLGVTITKDGKDERDILDKIRKGKTITSQLNSILWSLNIRKDTKKKIFRTIVESTATYGAEVWTITQNMKNRIKTLENGFWRRCCRLTLADRVTNEKIRDMMDIDTTITDNIEKKQLQWYGHMRRMNNARIPLKIWNWRPQRNRKRGRPRRRWKEGIDRAMQRRRIDEDAWTNKNQWRVDCEKRPQEL